MVEKPKISVIIPVYNVQKYLQRCIDSLLAQTYTNIELIFVDDGSTDNSFSILQKAALSDSRVRVLQQENSGPSAARNRGMENCTGEYIMFCDSDDTVEQNWCDEMLGMIRQNPGAWNICFLSVLDENGKRIMQLGDESMPSLLDKDGYWMTLKDGLSGSVNNKIFCSKIIRDNHLSFNLSLRRGEDVLFNIDYFRLTDRIAVSKKCLYNYYRYTGFETLTNRYHKDDFDTEMMLYTARRPLIDQKHMDWFLRFYWIKLSVVIERNISDVFAGSFLNRIRLNQTCIEHDEYQALARSFGPSEMHRLAYRFLTNKNYLGYWIVQKAALFKRKLLKKR